MSLIEEVIHGIIGGIVFSPVPMMKEPGDTYEIEKSLISLSIKTLAILSLLLPHNLTLHFPKHLISLSRVLLLH